MKHLIYLLLFLQVSVFAQNPDKKSENKSYLIVVSMDAFRWDYPDMYKTPTLDSIEKYGVKAHSLVPAYPSKTFPNHYTIATGLYPDNHGLVNNSFYDEHTDQVYQIRDRDKVTDGYFYGGEPIWNTVEKNDLLAASYFWVGSEADVQGMRPTYNKKYNTHDPFESRIDTVAKWLNYPVNQRPNLIMLYFHEPDGVGHRYGPNHRKTRKKVEYMDELLGQLTQKVNALPCADSVNIIILSDHGMGNISKKRVVVLSESIDTSLVQYAMGGNPVYNIKAKDGKVEELYTQLKSLKNISVWKKDEIPAHLNYGSNSRITDFNVVADSSWSILYTPRSSYDFGGTHGYVPENTDMHAIFYAIGPKFKKGKKISTFNNVDVYNLMCEILELTPAKNDGIKKTIFESLAD